MPKYEYVCNNADCVNVDEAIIIECAVRDYPGTHPPCGVCGQPMQRVFSVTEVLYDPQGMGGFHRTDYGKYGPYER